MVLCVFFSGTLYADSANKDKDVESVEEGRHRRHNWCPEANFSDEQKAAVRQLFESSKEKFKGWRDVEKEGKRGLRSSSQRS